MRRLTTLRSIAVLLTCATVPAWAAEPGPGQPATAVTPPAVQVHAPTVECLAHPPAAHADAPPAPFTPFMLGDFTGPVANLFSDVKIAEGESPRPVDRAFYKFNYYNNVDKTRWTDPTESIHNVDLYRHVLGLEKTFFDQRASLGLRVPFYTLEAEAKEFRVVPLPDAPGGAVVPGGPGISTTHFGNISAIAKAILWEDREAGTLLSAGATLSFPTASSKKINPGSSTLAYMQPFGGFIVNRGDLFVQGFLSVTFPVASAESIVLFTDLGVGYFVYRDASGTGFLTSVAPTFEVHIANPLRTPDPAVDVFGLVDDLKLHNVVDLTLGVTFEFRSAATLGIGIVSPVTGPKPFDVEALAQFNYRF